ncbi:C-X-C chemokine receptor type 3-like [Nematolebias whitei]|uniref:C-X-C chemokine receptor type 3-like n=1 Tax=Nematolebias whitei TaxID=451745 RepID=UPI00189A56D4|nr:C-X-C chemokine receptor type 3-like [Nematolebias whitei]
METISDGVLNQTDDYNYETYDYVQEEDERRTSQIIWLCIFYSVVLVVGLLGNILLVIILAQKRRSWKVLDSFILQLGVVDILLLLTLPVWAAQPCENCPNTLFAICRAVFNINFYIGIFLLVCIALVYYLTTSHAAWFSHHGAKLAFFSCLLVWLVSSLLTGLDWWFLEPEKDSPQGKAICAQKFGVNWLLGLRLLHLSVGFLLPVALFVILFSLVWRRQQSSGAKCIQKMRPILIILVLMGVFLVCWIPYNIALIADIICYSSQDVFSTFLESLKTALTVTSAIGCSNACLRPLLYFLLYGKFRRRTLNFFKCDTSGHQSSLWELSVGETAPCDQNQAAEEQKEMLHVEDLSTIK